MPSITHISSVLKFNIFAEKIKSSSFSDDLDTSFSNAVESVSSIFNHEESKIVIDKLLNQKCTKSGKVHAELITKVITGADTQWALPIKILYNSKKDILKIDGWFFLNPFFTQSNFF